MLIPFDEVLYRQPTPAGEPRPTQVIYLNPAYVVSVNKLPETSSGRQERCCVTMASRQDEEENDSWPIAGDHNEIARIINTALNPAYHAQS